MKKNKKPVKNVVVKGSNKEKPRRLPCVPLYAA